MARSRYKRIHRPDHHRSDTCGFVKEHFLVAEEVLGRELYKGETVHHKDGNTYNNSKENIMVFKTLADHTMFHKGGTPVPLPDGSYSCKSSKMIYGTRCIQCGKLKKCKTLRCIECYNKDKAKHIPSKEDLEVLVWSKPTTHIAKEYGVSDTAISKWCRKLGIEKPPRGYWSKNNI